MHRSLLLAAIFAVGCDEGPTENALAVVITTAAGSNPASGAGPGTLRVRIDQGEGHDQEVTTALSAGSFELSAPALDHATLTRFQARFEFEGGAQRIGAVPYFVPLYAGFVSIVVGAPGSCETLVEPQTDARIGAALVPLTINPILIGGATGSSDSAAGHVDVDALTTIHLADTAAFTDNSQVYSDLTREMRETHAVPLAEPTSESAPFLVVGRGPTEAAFAYDANRAVEVSIAAHEGAGSESALLDLGANGAAIVGGSLSGVPVRGITWVADDATVVARTELANPRTRPAAVALEGGLLIAGGQAEGQPLLEWVPLHDNGVPVGADTEARELPILIRDPTRSSAILLGGSRNGELVSRIDHIACQGGCASRSLVETWSAPRLRPAIADTAEATWLLGGEDGAGVASTKVERVRLEGESVLFDVSLDLPRARARGAAIEVAAGVVMLAGGIAATDPVRDVVLCWPPALEGN